MQNRKKHFIRQRAQTVAEYSIFIGVIVVALVVMNTYVKRGLAARLKDASDLPLRSQEILGLETNFTTGHYEPEYYSSVRETNYDTDGSERMFIGGSMQSLSDSHGSMSATEIIDDTD